MVARTYIYLRLKFIDLAINLRAFTSCPCAKCNRLICRVGIGELSSACAVMCMYQYTICSRHLTNQVVIFIPRNYQ